MTFANRARERERERDQVSELKSWTANLLQWMWLRFGVLGDVSVERAILDNVINVCLKVYNSHL